MSESLSISNPEPAAPHPSVQTWIDYHAGAVSDEAAEGLRRHLCACRRCVDLILDLDAFTELAPPPGAAADFEKAAVWRTVKGTLARRPASRIRRWPAVAAVAASLCFAALGFSAWNARQESFGELTELRSQVAALSTLHANPVVLSLRPGERQRGAADAAEVADLVGGSRLLITILNLPGDVDYPAYEVRVFDANGEEVDRFADLKISDLGNFSLAIVPGRLAAGSYELRLLGLETGLEHPLESYALEVR